MFLFDFLLSFEAFTARLHIYTYIHIYVYIYIYIYNRAANASNDNRKSKRNNIIYIYNNIIYIYNGFSQANKHYVFSVCISLVISSLLISNIVILSLNVAWSTPRQITKSSFHFISDYGVIIFVIPQWFVQIIRHYIADAQVDEP